MLSKGSTGQPIFILTGMGCSFDEWYEVSEELSKTNQVIMFHRPGLGESELGDDTRNTQAAVLDLLNVVNHLGINEPIYLVGHSYGGLCAQHFAKVHPGIVKGMVLVDSTSVDLKILDDLDLPVMDEESDEVWITKCQDYAGKTKEQLEDLIRPSLEREHQSFPESVQQRLLEFKVNPLLYKAMASEIRHWKEDAEEIKSLGKFPDIPLIVIGRDKEHSMILEEYNRIPEWEVRKFEETWEKLIKDQSKLSVNSRLIFADQSGHAVYLDRPDVIIEAIHKLIFSTEGSRI
ncbi:alpha/beta fold hydrolase [Bacillus salacetis]|uniref:Alpha/beta fold hydrolase n=1 Tax=Bacillus salacetis TaxID=2315464 RepID=A0A3A1QT96_9BACI|nr:alpha/beta fold hydrolase [Bacillus salacetis]